MLKLYVALWSRIDCNNYSGFVNEDQRALQSTTSRNTGLLNAKTFNGLLFWKGFCLAQNASTSLDWVELQKSRRGHFASIVELLSFLIMDPKGHAINIYNCCVL